MKILHSIKKRSLASIHGRTRAIFLHIQKTAGSSIIKLARSLYGEDMVSHGEYIGKSHAILDDISFVSGHFGYVYAQPLMESRHCFTFLRNPVDRILSFYFFGRSRKPNQYPIYQLCHDLNLEEFLQAGFTNPLIKQYIWNHQTWQLAYGWGDPKAVHSETDLLSQAILQLGKYPEEKLLFDAINHLNQFTYVGFTETFEQDRNIILAKLKLPIPKGKVTENITPNRPDRYSLSNLERNLLSELTYLDQRLYEAAWAKFHPHPNSN